MAWHVEAYARHKRLPSLTNELKKLRRDEKTAVPKTPDWKVNQDFMKAKAEAAKKKKPK